MSIGTIVGISIGVVLLVGLICFFINEKKSIKEWLLLAVIEAEKALGSKTGRLKLRQVFKEFIALFPIFSKFITFSRFSKWVDLALQQMANCLKSNAVIKEYVGIEDNTVE